MLDDDDLDDPAIRTLHEVLLALDTLPRAEALARIAPCWPGRNASLALALAERLAPRPAFLAAAIACARWALPARTRSVPAHEAALATAEAYLSGRADRTAMEAARLAAGSTISRHVAGVDDDVALAVHDTCELVLDEPFEYAGPDPPFRACWAWAQRRSQHPYRDTADHDRDAHAELSAVIAAVIPSLGR